jgi:hypothetical protein
MAFHHVAGWKGMRKGMGFDESLLLTRKWLRHHLAKQTSPQNRNMRERAAGSNRAGTRAFTCIF